MESNRSYRLTLEDRIKLEYMRNQGYSISGIARELGVHYTTIYRELLRGKTGDVTKYGDPQYDAERAQRKAIVMRGRQGKPRRDIPIDFD